MPRSPADDPDELRAGRLRTEVPEYRDRAPEAGVTRNARGQSLDDAREAFQVEWQAKVQEKRQAVVRSRKLAAWYGKARGRIFVGGSLLGAAFGVYLAGLSGESIAGLWAYLPHGVIWGAVGGLFYATPLAMVALLCEWFWQQRAKRLEREVRDLERS